MVKIILLLVTALALVDIASADTFGAGTNRFEIDFVTISGDASNANGRKISMYPQESPYYKSFTDPGDFRMGTYEITNAQWNKFVNSNGLVTGTPSDAYDRSTIWGGANLPVTGVSWYEAIQFVNWLNISTGHQAAYKFTGTQGQSDYTFAVWDVTDIGYNDSNPYRNSNAFYFLPTDDEWVKAGYWNGTIIQSFATSNGYVPVAGRDTNYDQDNPPAGPWNVGSGSEELNGTYDMMGNVFEWMEGAYHSEIERGLRGGAYAIGDLGIINASGLTYGKAYNEYDSVGFRVASVVPEPSTLALLILGGLMIQKKGYKGNQA